ncbi:MAG: peptidyl-dipeptidase Dcp [Salibacteraceae bacterium]|jgi:peptidyl-dipeptidase Dcp
MRLYICKMSKDNPFFQAFSTPHDSIPFDKISHEHFLPALKESINIAKKEIDAIKLCEQPDFVSVIEAMEKSGKLLGTVTAAFFNLNSAETNDELQAIAGDFSGKISAFSSEVNTDQILFDQIKKAKEATDVTSLSTEQKTLLEKTFNRFSRNGALLSIVDKEKLKEIDQNLAQLKVDFGQNLLNDSNTYLKVFDDKTSLNGLSNSLIDQAQQLAESKDHKDKWAVNLDYPSYIPFMTYASNSELRKELFIAYARRAAQDNEFNNKLVLEEIAKFRLKRARLLGFKSHADFTLAERMASTPSKVHEFLNDLLDKSLGKAKEQVNEVSLFAVENGAILPLQRWDFTYWSEKLKQSKYNLEDEVLKPYFKLENALDGVFKTANKLFGLTFREVSNIPKYHEDVQTFEVYGEQDEFIAVFYADFFPRAGKRNGAWMTSFKGQSIENGENNRPHISIVCNFSKPTPAEPSLLTFQEVRTLFHEFGHALHGILANTQYESLSGTGVYWDFVELPSQIFENWLYEKECLELFAYHYKTGELIPKELIQAIKDSAAFLEGYQTIRQLSFAILDMAWHDSRSENELNLSQIEERVLSASDLFPAVSGTSMSTSFAHIFSGGYSAGYYSYKWAEVLDADAFEKFKEDGLFNKETAKSFRYNILEKGGTEHPMDLYVRFRGKEPSTKALLDRAQLN